MICHFFHLRANFYSFSTLTCHMFQLKRSEKMKLKETNYLRPTTDCDFVQCPMKSSSITPKMESSIKNTIPTVR